MKLPPRAQMYQAFLERDAGYEGVFVAAVRTTGIFCRPSCPAKKPRLENVEFYASTREATDAGFRPCLRCRPLDPNGQAPEWIAPVLARVDEDPTRRWTDQDLRDLGVEPVRVRRWFQKHHGMTFQAYSRSRRLGEALGRIQEGAEITTTGYDHGYDSLSGFYDAFRRLFGDAPGARRRASSEPPVMVNRMKTPLGPMIAAASERHLLLLEFVDRRMLESQISRLEKLCDAPFVPGDNELLRETQRELDAYFAGRLQRFTVPYETPGTDFQQSVWRQLTTIPYGETRSYAEQAAAIGRPKAVRAVARANGDNRLAIIVPCHRVVGSDGRLTGYGGQLWRKKALLELEAGGAMTAETVLCP